MTEIDWKARAVAAEAERDDLRKRLQSCAESVCAEERKTVAAETRIAAALAVLDALPEFDDSAVRAALVEPVEEPPMPCRYCGRDKECRDRGCTLWERNADADRRCAPGDEAMTPEQKDTDACSNNGANVRHLGSAPIMEHRQTFIDAALAAMGHGTPFALAKDLDKLTAAGFSVSLASVRDHTNCQDCGNREWICSGWAAAIRPCRGPGCLFDHIPCPGGSPVVWSTEP